MWRPKSKDGYTGQVKSGMNMLKYQKINFLIKIALEAMHMKQRYLWW